jgi:hypothetical protein
MPPGDAASVRAATHVLVRSPRRHAELSWFLRAPFQISKRAAGQAAEFSRSGVELLGVIGAARFERGEPPAEAGELIGRQLGNRLGDFFDLHVAQYSRSEDQPRAGFLLLNCSPHLNFSPIRDFADNDVTLRVNRDTMGVRKISTLVTGPPEFCEHLSCGPVQDMNDIIGAVGNI